MDGMRPQFSLRKSLIAAALLEIGVVAFIVGVRRELRNPRSNDEDAVAMCVVAVGTVFIGAGAGLFLVRPSIAMAIGVASPFVAYFLLGVLYWACLIIYVIIRGCFG
jgi:hypothetical protein